MRSWIDAFLLPFRESLTWYLRDRQRRQDLRAKQTIWAQDDSVCDRCGAKSEEAKTNWRGFCDSCVEGDVW